MITIFLASLSTQEALRELEELKEIVPKESLVYFVIGKVSTGGDHQFSHQRLIFMSPY